MNGYGVPMTVAGVGFGQPARWIYSYLGMGDKLQVYGINNHVSMVFNLNFADEVDQKLSILRDMCREGDIAEEDLMELEERLRTVCSNYSGRNTMHQSSAALGLGESLSYSVYRDGRRVERVPDKAHCGRKVVRAY